MRKIIIILSIVVLFILIFVTAQNAKGNIGYKFENNNQFLRMWNDGESYCVNLSSGLQFGTDLTDSCSGSFFNKNEICLESGAFRRCFEQIPLSTYVISSDNQTYVNLTFIKSPDISNTVSLTYTLFNETDFKLYQDFRVTNNLITSRKFNFSYIIKDIKIGRNVNDELIYINDSIFPLTRNNNSYYNGSFDGFSIIDGKTQRYFHLGFPYDLDNVIHIKGRSSINVTILNQQIPRTSAKSLQFSYFDPAGTCTSLADIQNYSNGCWGNQFTVSATTTQALTSTSVQRLAFRFNESNGCYLTGDSFRVSAVSGSANLIYGIQYDNPATFRPNGTWLDNQSADVLAGVQSLNLFGGANLTKNQAYHFVLDATFFPIGVSKTILYIQPQQFKHPYDYTDNKAMLVAIFGAAKWTTQTSHTSLFELRCNSTSDVTKTVNNPTAWTYDNPNGVGTLSGINVLAQYLKVPFKMNISQIGLELNMPDGFAGDNVTIEIYNNKSLTTALATAKINVTGATSAWYDANLSNNVILNTTDVYLIKTLCPLCDGILGEITWALTRESAGHIVPNNGTWLGMEGYRATSSNNGTTWSVGAANLRTDMVFRLYGNQLQPPNWSSVQINQPTVFTNSIINFSTVWSDDKNLKGGGYIFEINQSTNYVNSSFIAFPGLSETVSFNITTITSPNGFNVTWRFYANDSDDNWNITPLQSFIVGEVASPIQVISNIPDSISQNISREFTIQVYNQTSIITSQITCYLDIYNDTFIGQQVLTSSSNNVYRFNVPNNNFTNKGSYSSRAYCNSSSTAGLLQNSFYVTKGGDLPANDDLKKFIYFLFVFAFIGLIITFGLNLAKLPIFEIYLYNVLFSVSFYIIFLLDFMLAENYLLNPFVENIFKTFIMPFAFTNIVFPMLGFLITFIKTILSKKKYNINKT